MSMRVLFYVQHILGIGHVARASRIVSAMHAHGLDATVVQGGVAVEGIGWGGAATEALPAIRAGAGGYADLVDEAGEPVSEALRERRRVRLMQICRNVRPHLIVTEAFPFGRRAMRFELLPVLKEMRALARPPLVACSIRDILHENRKADLNEKTVRLLDDYFDLIFVHGDPSFIALEESFPLSGRIAGKVRYTGIVAPGEGKGLESEPFDIVVSAGGGAVGDGLLLSAADALHGQAFASSKACLITGPNLSDDAVRALRRTAPATAQVVRFREDFPALLARAALSVSQCGYNTSADVLKARCRAVFVPSAYQGETEQTRRARALGRRGLAKVVEESELTAANLQRAMEEALAGPEPDAALLPDLDGAATCARIVASLQKEPGNAVV